MVLPNGAVLRDGLAILLYLESHRKSSSRGDDDDDGGGYGVVLSRLQESLNLLRLTETLEGEGKAVSELRKELRIWEAYLQSNNSSSSSKDDGGFICGSQKTLADYAVYSSLALSVHRGLRLAPDFPCLERYVKTMACESGTTRTPLQHGQDDGGLL